MPISASQARASGEVPTPIMGARTRLLIPLEKPPPRTSEEPEGHAALPSVKVAVWRRGDWRVDDLRRQREMGMQATGRDGERVGAADCRI